MTTRVTVRSVRVGQATRLSQLTDIDATDVDDKETAVWDAELEKFVIKALPLIDGGTF
jgi:hypothetical protein